MMTGTPIPAPSLEAPLLEAPLLEACNLTRRFGGLAASDRLSLAVPAGELHALIGPNGAGKTTLIAQLSGELRPDSGRIRFAGHDITDWAVHRRARLGLARNFQITSVFPGFTAIDNVALAVQATAGHSFRFWGDAGRDGRLTLPAAAVLERVGLGARARVPAGELAHGEARQLELAMALAGRPRLLLLDEPMAGLGPEESVRMVTLLAALKAEVTILLVEHDMDAVFALADRITVLVRGRAVACGTPAAIRADRLVRGAYLGDEGADGPDGEARPCCG
jgi:branched-chain amino acid transport system ATP-binding protein